MKHSVVEFHSLSIGYPGRKNKSNVLARDLNATLQSGELVCLLGPNGAGKSTLLRTLTGMLEPLAGTILFQGRDLHSYSSRELARQLSVVLTHRVAAGAMPVETLISLGRYPYTDWAGRIGESDRKAVERAIAAVGISPLAKRAFSKLSDGEQQKTLIARALAQEPDVMILDEPTAFLDLPRRVELTHLLRRLAHDDGRAILMSTHELDLAIRTADRLWLLPPGGPLIEGAPEDLVLRGDLSPVFQTDSVHFDAEAGAFRSHSTHGEAVSLRGEGAVWAWTSRALERRSYRVIHNASELPKVEVNGTAAAPSWLVHTPSAVIECASIEAMLHALADWTRPQ